MILIFFFFFFFTTEYLTNLGTFSAPERLGTYFKFFWSWTDSFSAPNGFPEALWRNTCGNYSWDKYFTTLSDDGKGDACSASSAMSTMRFLNFLWWCRHVQRQIILTKKQQQQQKRKEKRGKKQANTKTKIKQQQNKNNNRRRRRRKTQVNTASDDTHIITVPNYIFCSMPSIHEEVVQLQNATQTHT